MRQKVFVVRGAPMENKYRLTQEQIEAIERVVNRGDRVEIVPVRDGLKIMKVRRETIKKEYN